MIRAILVVQLETIKRNRLTFLLLVLTAIGVVCVGVRHGAMLECAAYLLVMWLCTFFVDWFAIKRPPQDNFPVRNAKRESMYFFACAFIGILFLIIRSSGIVDWQQLSGLVRLAFVPMLAFVFPIALAAIMLMLKYKPAELGLRFQGLIVVVPIIAMSALTNRIVAPQNFTWDMVMAESGSVIGAIWSGFILAGLSEEFFRVAGQTRLGALLHSKSLGWFFVTVLWAFMHAPKWYGEEHDLAEALLGSIRIIPIGLMWGYITHRTKSFLPAMIVHGTNYWGLQNF